MEGKHPRISVVIADGQPLYREGLARLFRIREPFELVAQVASGLSALSVIAADPPDVAVLAVQLGDMTAIEALHELRLIADSSVRVLVLSDKDEGATAYESIAAGANGYLLKTADRHEICDAVLAVAAGATVIPVGVHDGLAAEIRHRADASPVLLSAREIDVLRSAAEGGSTREVADRLVISPATVKTHLRHIYEKLEVGDRASAVAEGMRRGLLD